MFTANDVEEPNVDDDVLMQVVKEMKVLRAEFKASQALMMSESKASQALLISEFKASQALMMSEFRRECNKTCYNNPIGKF